MGARVTKESLYLRRVFTKDERLEMGVGLAESYNRMTQIEEEEAVMKANIKNQKAGVEQTIGMLSRHLADGFTMENVDCSLEWDTPHVGEVSYKRKDNGQIAKTRAMTESENQLELELAQAQTEAETAPAAESVVNIEEFFGKGSVDAMTAQDAGNSAIADDDDDDEEEEKDEEAVFSDTNPAAAMEAIKPEHDAAWDGVGEQPVKRGRGRPKKVVQETAEAF